MDVIEEMLTCPICMEKFQLSEGLVPRLLSCAHTFCENCLTRQSNSQTTRVCAVCRRQTSLTREGVKGLPRNLSITTLIELRSPRLQHGQEQEVDNEKAGLQKRKKRKERKCDNCLEDKGGEEGDEIEMIPDATLYCKQCELFLCNACNLGVHVAAALRRHERIDADKAPAPRPQCTTHAGTPMEFWCVIDSVAVCKICCISGAHKGHEAINLDEVMQRKREEGEKFVLELEKVIEKLDAKEKGRMEANREREDRVENWTEEIASTFAKLRLMVNQREAQLLRELREWDEGQERTVAADLDLVRTWTVDLKAIKEELENAIGGGNQTNGEDDVPGEWISHLLLEAKKLAEVAESLLSLLDVDNSSEVTEGWVTIDAKQTKIASDAIAKIATLSLTQNVNTNTNSNNSNKERTTKTTKVKAKQEKEKEKEREKRKEKPATVWLKKEGGMIWTPFSARLSEEIEDAYENGEECFRFEDRGKVYVLEFDSLRCYSDRAKGKWEAVKRKTRAWFAN